MASILYISTHGTDDPTRASLPWMGANGAKEAGHQPSIALLGEATYMMKGSIAEGVKGVGFEPLNNLMKIAMDNKVPIYV
jgi:predicted peroxiredoxin